jgi:hypothetical protein
MKSLIMKKGICTRVSAKRFQIEQFQQKAQKKIEGTNITLHRRVNKD